MKTAIIGAIVCAVIGAIIGGFILRFVFTWSVRIMGAKTIIFHTLLVLMGGVIGGMCTALATIPVGLKAIKKGTDKEIVGSISIILGSISGIIAALLGYFATSMFARYGIFDFAGTSFFGILIVGFFGFLGGISGCWMTLTFLKIVPKT